MFQFPPRSLWHQFVSWTKNCSFKVIQSKSISTFEVENPDSNIRIDDSDELPQNQTSLEPKGKHNWKKITERNRPQVQGLSYSDDFTEEIQNASTALQKKVFWVFH